MTHFMISRDRFLDNLTEFFKTVVAPSCPTHFVEFELLFLMVQKYFKIYCEKFDTTGFYEY